MSASPSLILSTRDARRLEALIASPVAAGAETARMLEDEIARADFREPDEMPPDVVSMDSGVVCIDEDSGIERTLRLVYPGAPAASDHDVSVLAPVGAALLGLSVGQSIEWPMRDGRSARLRVLRVTPASAGIGRAREAR